MLEKEYALIEEANKALQSAKEFNEEILNDTFESLEDVKTVIVERKFEEMFDDAINHTQEYIDNPRDLYAVGFQWSNYHQNEGGVDIEILDSYDKVIKHSAELYILEHELDAKYEEDANGELVKVPYDEKEIITMLEESNGYWDMEPGDADNENSAQVRIKQII